MPSSPCISCGQPLSPDANQPHCHHCSQPDGSLKRFEDVLQGMTGYLQRAHGMSAEGAREAARAALSQMPAWQDRS